MDVLKHLLIPVRISNLHILTFTLKSTTITDWDNKPGDFSFPIVHFTFICNNIPTVPNTENLYASINAMFLDPCASYLNFLNRIGYCCCRTNYTRVCNQIDATGATSGARTADPSRAPEFTPGFQWSSCCSIFSFICMFCRSLFVLLSFFFRPLCCLSFFDLRILITSLVPSNSS